MLQPPYKLDRRTGQTVLDALREVCSARDWQLLAAHVRSKHVHCVVGGVAQPNRVIADFKAYSSRALNHSEGYRKRWAREGSTHRLPTTTAIETAVHYVVNGQGEPMTVFRCA